MQERGRLKLYIGNMFSDKSSFFITEIRKRRRFCKNRVLVLKPEADTRSPKGFLQTYKGIKLPAHEVPEHNPSGVLRLIAEQESKQGCQFHTIAFDEIQFFSVENGFRLIDELLRRGYDVLASGLDLDFRKEPFGCTLALNGLCSRTSDILKCYSVCAQCYDEAMLSQRLIDGKPAHYNSPQILVGGKEMYEPRCHKCFELPGEPRIVL